MNIYLIRHGDAEKVAIGKKDYDRELTPSGKLKLKSAAKSWKNIIDNFDCIYSSPLTRAYQTAQIIAEVFELKNKIIVDNKISPGCKSDSILELANAAGKEDIAFVGHQPDFSEILSELISNKDAYIEFKKGAIAKIVFGSKARLSRGILEFLIPASVFKE